jgi:hypothetical protein
MAVFLSPVGGAAAQFFDNNGVILSGGKLYTYAAGTTTPAATYTSSSGSTAHTNPIILDSAGRVPGGETWLTTNTSYKFLLKDANDVLIGTYDNISGIDDSYELLAYEAAVAASSGSSLVGYTQGGTGAVAQTVQSKLRQVVSVADFGASPSASASVNTAAIQAAINSIPETEGGTITFPRGVYNVNGNIDTNNRQGLIIEGNDAGINLTTSVSYLFTVTDVAVQIRNLSLSKNTGVVASAFYVSGIRHIFDNVGSGDSKWTYFFHCVGVKESFFTNLNIYLDVATKTGSVFRLDYCVNNTFSDSFIGYCEHGIYESGTSNPSGGNKSEGWLMSNVIIVYPQKAMTLDAGTLFSVTNCCFDFCEIWGIFQSNGNNLKVTNTWIASNTTNGFIGVGTVNTVYGVSVIGNVFVRGASAITGTAGVSLSGPNAIVVGNAFQGGMNGGVVTDTGSQVIGNSVSAPGTNIVANATNATILGTLFVETDISVGGSKGVFPQGVSGSATAGTNGATPAQVRGYVTVTFNDGSGLANYKIPYYNV